MRHNCREYVLCSTHRSSWGSLKINWTKKKKSLKKLFVLKRQIKSPYRFRHLSESFSTPSLKTLPPISGIYYSILHFLVISESFLGNRTEHGEITRRNVWAIRRMFPLFPISTSGSCEEETF